MTIGLKRIALIVAGGTGTRMGNGTPKQFLLLKGRPLLMHTLEKFHEVSDEVIVVLPEEWKEHWNGLCAQYNFQVPVKVVTGGSTRAISVKNGFSLIENDCIVAVHDAARPFVSSSLITRLYIEAAENGNSIPVVPLNDSMRIIEGMESKPVDRTIYRLVQTPQCFHYSQLAEAFKREDFQLYTDEASLVQAAGKQVFMSEGEPSNIKITLPSDFIYAEYYLKSIE